MTEWLQVSHANRYNQMYIKGFLDISGGNLILRNNNLLIKTGDASMNGNLYVGRTAFLQNTVCLGDLSINGNISGTFKPNSIDPTAIIGGIPEATGIFSQDVSMNHGLYVQRTTTLNGNLAVSGKSVFSKDISLNANLYSTAVFENGVSLASKYAALSGATFTGTTTIPTANIQTLRISGDASMNGNVFVGAALYEGGVALAAKYATLASPTFTGVPMAPTPDFASSNTQVATTSFVKSQLVGYVTLQAPSFLGSITTPKLFATNDASLNARLFVNGDVSMNGLLRVGKTLTVAGDVTANGALRVAGDVSANGALRVGGDVSANGGLRIRGDASLNSGLDISGAVIARNNVSIYGIINQYTTATNLIANTGASGSNNLVLGVGAGAALTSGSNNTLVGAGAGAAVTSGSNNLVLGAGAAASSATVSNEITLGNTSTTTLRCQAGTITSLSDLRDKKDVEALSVGLDFVGALNPVKFTWNMRDGSRMGDLDFGFIAQELQGVQTTTGVSVPNLVYDSNPERLEASYAVLIPILVKSIQELKAVVEKQRADIDALMSAAGK